MRSPAEYGQPSCGVLWGGTDGVGREYVRSSVESGPPIGGPFGSGVQPTSSATEQTAPAILSVVAGRRIGQFYLSFKTLQIKPPDNRLFRF